MFNHGCLPWNSLNLGANLWFCIPNFKLDLLKQGIYYCQCISNECMMNSFADIVMARCNFQELDLTNPATFRDLSKPMGAQTPNRLEQFKKRYKDWDDPQGTISWVGPIASSIVCTITCVITNYHWYCDMNTIVIIIVVFPHFYISVWLGP